MESLPAVLEVVKQGGTIAVAVFAIAGWYLERQERIQLQKTLIDYVSTSGTNQVISNNNVISAINALKDLISQVIRSSHVF